MKTLATRKKIYVALTISPLLLLSGCAPFDWIKEKFSSPNKSQVKTKTKTKRSKRGAKTVSGEWVVKVGDEVIVSSNEFENELNQLLEDRPQLKQMLPLMPNLAGDFARGLGNQEIIARFIEEKGFDKKAEYQEKKERMLRAVDQMINAEFFTKAMDPVKLTDTDLKKFYDENKDTMQGILISRGGINTVGVSFDKKTDAEAFLTKAKAEKDLDLQKLAKASGFKAHDFNLVQGQSFGIDPVLRTKIMGLKTFPTVAMLPVNDKTFWVVNATEKQESQYHPFAQIKDGIRNVAEQAEKGKQVQAELEKLNKTYGVQVNEKYLQERKKTQMATGQQVQGQGPAQITSEQLAQALTQAQAQEAAKSNAESKAV